MPPAAAVAAAALACEGLRTLSPWDPRQQRPHHPTNALAANDTADARCHNRANERLKFRRFNLKVRSFGSIALLLVLAASLGFGLVVLGLAGRTLILVAALRVGSEQFLAGFNVLFGV